MSYEKAEELIHLATLMQGSAEGVSLLDITREFGVSRRTAERMRDAVQRLCPDIEAIDDDGGRRRWRIRGANVLAQLATVNAPELAALEHAIELQANVRQGDHHERLLSLSEKLRAALTHRLRTRLEPDIEALMEAEGLAMRPGPHPLDEHHVVTALRDAILSSSVVLLHHQPRGSKAKRRQKVHPYGFLYGNRHYLVAFSIEARDFRLFTLSNIDHVEAQTEHFARDPEFSLKAYAERSFGVFQGDEVQDVEWRFAPEVADDVRRFLFHPTQTMETNDDGSITVRFRACGLREMCWHLVTWAGYVKVVAPKELKAAYKMNVLETRV
ncbi:WYL domain-containing protein [Parvibaculum sp.]|uniref:helix-turn-helix transcriptional regulator n=1 Tax=Parvibaculum sp. TaxID=2024848 RepID=UPI00320DA60D